MYDLKKEFPASGSTNHLFILIKLFAAAIVKPVRINQIQKAIHAYEEMPSPVVVVFACTEITLSVHNVRWVQIA